MFQGPLAVLRRGLRAHPDLSSLIFIVTLAIAVRVVFLYGAPVFIDGDSFQYYRPAQKLMRGEGFPIALKRPPLYPFLIFGVGELFGEDLRNLVAVQTTLGVATSGLVFGFGRLAFGRLAGCIGGLAAALGGPLLIYEHYVMTETLFTFLLALALFSYLAGARSGRLSWYATSGLAIGLAALTRPHAQVLPALAVLVLAIHLRPWRAVVKASAILVLAFSLAVLPWMIRTQLEYGVFSIATATGQHLFRQTALLHAGAYRFDDPANPGARSDPTYREAAEKIQDISEDKANGKGQGWSAPSLHGWLMRSLDLSDAEADALMQAVSVSAIRARPLVYLQHQVADLAAIFQGSFVELTDPWATARPGEVQARLTALMRAPSPEQEAAFPWLDRLASYQPITLGPLLPLLALLGLLASASRRAWRPGLLVGLSVVILTLVSAAVVGHNPRFNIPISPFLHVLAAAGATALWQWSRRLPGEGTPSRRAQPAPPS